eukprot:144429-Amphidinium_carterae.1
MSPETTPTPPPKLAPLAQNKDESSLGSSSHMVVVCMACLLFAGFAWGVRRDDEPVTLPVKGARLQHGKLERSSKAIANGCTFFENSIGSVALNIYADAIGGRVPELNHSYPCKQPYEFCARSFAGYMTFTTP